MMDQEFGSLGYFRARFYRKFFIWNFLKKVCIAQNEKMMSIQEKLTELSESKTLENIQNTYGNDFLTRLFQSSQKNNLG